MNDPDERTVSRDRLNTPAGGRGTVDWNEDAQTRPTGNAAVRSDTPTRVVELVSTGTPTLAVDNDDMGAVSGQEVRALTELSWDARVLPVLTAAESICADWDIELDSWAGRVVLPVRDRKIIPVVVRLEDGGVVESFDDDVRATREGEAERSNLLARAVVANELVRLFSDAGHSRLRAPHEEIWRRLPAAMERAPVSPAECLAAHNRRLARFEGAQVVEALVGWKYRRIGVSNGAGAALRVVAGNRLSDERLGALNALPAAFERAMWVYARTTGQWAASGPLVVGSGARRRLFASDAGGGWVLDVPLGDVGVAARALSSMTETG